MAFLFQVYRSWGDDAVSSSRLFLQIVRKPFSEVRNHYWGPLWWTLEVFVGSRDMYLSTNASMGPSECNYRGGMIFWGKVERFHHWGKEETASHREAMLLNPLCSMGYQSCFMAKGIPDFVPYKSSHTADVWARQYCCDFASTQDCCW